MDFNPYYSSIKTMDFIKYQVKNSSLNPIRYITLKYSFSIYNNMFCNILSKLFGKKEKNVEKIEDKKLEENA